MPGGDSMTFPTPPSLKESQQSTAPKLMDSRKQAQLLIVMVENWLQG